MTLPSAVCLLGILSFVIAFIATVLMIRISPRVGLVDKPGGHKTHRAPKPLGGGVAITLAISLPIVVGLIALSTHHAASTSEIDAYWRGAQQQWPLAMGLLIAILIIHVIGLIDDRRALGPMTKLFSQLLISGGLIVAMELLARHTPSLRLRALTALDHIGLGIWPSLIATVLWITAITNAFNFLDNMDGLSAGVAAVCTTAFLIAAVSIEQWFVAATLALLLGSLLGFLVWNFPPAKIFMGDSGSLVVGLLLGVLTVRTTYLSPGENISRSWYALFAPVIVLALPLYDLVVVSIIRLSRGVSPFKGDNNHFSHRLVARGMTRRTAVLCLYLVTAATSVAAILLPHLHSSWQAMLIFGQTILVLALVALLEQHPLPAPEIETSPAPAPQITNHGTR